MKLLFFTHYQQSYEWLLNWKRAPSRRTSCLRPVVRLCRSATVTHRNTHVSKSAALKTGIDLYAAHLAAK